MIRDLVNLDQIDQINDNIISDHICNINIPEHHRDQINSLLVSI